MKNQLLFNTVFPLQTFTSHTSATIIQGVSLYKTHVLARQTSVARISKKYITFYFFFFLHEPKMEDNFCLKKKTFFFFFMSQKWKNSFGFLQFQNENKITAKRSPTQVFIWNLNYTINMDTLIPTCVSSHHRAGMSNSPLTDPCCFHSDHGCGTGRRKDDWAGDNGVTAKLQWEGVDWERCAQSEPWSPCGHPHCLQSFHRCAESLE